MVVVGVPSVSLLHRTSLALLSARVLPLVTMLASWRRVTCARGVDSLLLLLAQQVNNCNAWADWSITTHHRPGESFVCCVHTVIQTHASALEGFVGWIKWVKRHLL